MSIGKLVGHETPIRALRSDSTDHHIISMGALTCRLPHARALTSQRCVCASRGGCAGTDNVIKVWDIRNFRCLQTLTDGAAGLFTSLDSQSLYSCMLYDERHKRLLACNSGMTSFKNRAHAEVFLGKAHPKPVVAALYNPVFHEVRSLGVARCHSDGVARHFDQRITRASLPPAQSAVPGNRDRVCLCLCMF